jgi:hypothetical protein
MFINCTPHTLNIVRVDGTILEIAPSGVCPRVGTTRLEAGVIEGVETFFTELGSVENLPPREEGSLFIVSRMVLDACPDRSDLLCPGELVRDAQGRVIGCKGLSL